MNDVTLLLTPSSAGVPVSHLSLDELRTEAERTENALALAVLHEISDGRDHARELNNAGYNTVVEMADEIDRLASSNEELDEALRVSELDLAAYQNKVKDVTDTLRAGLDDLLMEDDISERVRVQVSTLIDDLSEL